MNKIKKKPIIFFVAALVVLYVIIYVIPDVTGALVSSYTAEYGQMRIADDTTGYIVRDEQVYVAGTGGKANRYIEEGTLIRRGTTVMEVSGSGGDEKDEKYTSLLSNLDDSHRVNTSDFAVSGGGIVCYYADGFESKVTPETMEGGDYEFYSALNSVETVELARKTVVSGEPVFKIVDRTKWYIVCFVEKDSLSRYEEGDEITVEFEDESILTKVYKTDKQGKRARIILETDHYYERFAQMRSAKISLVTYDEKGLIVENSSIAEEDGVQGVYVKNHNKDFAFVPIQVLMSDGEKSLIADTYFRDDGGEVIYTVETYDEILRDPK